MLRHGFIQVCQCGLYYLILVVLLELLRLLRFDASPILQHMVLGDLLHEHSGLSGLHAQHYTLFRPRIPTSDVEPGSIL